MPRSGNKNTDGFNVAKPLMGKVTGFAADSTWHKQGADDRIALPNTPFPFDGIYGYHYQESPVLRFAPNDPGVWHLETTLTTYGTQAFHLASDVVKGIRSNTVTVLPFDDPACQAAFSD
jgi:hypothetical protein